MMQLLCHITTRKTIALTIQTFVDKVMSLLFSTLFRFVIAFLPRSKYLWISWLQILISWHSDFGAQENESVTISSFPIYMHEVMGPDAMLLVFWMMSLSQHYVYRINYNYQVNDNYQIKMTRKLNRHFIKESHE